MKPIGLLGGMPVLAARLLQAQISVTLTPSRPSPVPLGTVVRWTASASGPNLGTPTYRFRAGPAGAPLRTVVDYGPNSSLDWTTIEREGTYEVEVTARSGDRAKAASASVRMAMTSLVTGNTPVITPTTANPLVFIYSAPPCPTGQVLSAQFTSPEGYVQSTPAKACNGFSMNFYLAGMRSQAQYSIQQMAANETPAAGSPPLAVTIAGVGLQAPPASILAMDPPAAGGIILQSSFASPPAIATDLEGNIVWYYGGNISYLTRPVAGGTFMGLAEDGTKDPSQQLFREFDLAGITLAETNAARVNEQLAAMGVNFINGFHHEARKLADGDYLVLADSERILTDVQGPGPVDVIGDTILILDPNLEVLWAWDAFDHLDPHRAAILGETCSYPAGVSCGPFYLAPTANDWLHGNAVQLTPDGNLLYSARHQDWVIKIDYDNGAGAGNVLWRLGAEGDFRLAGAGPAQPYRPARNLSAGQAPVAPDSPGAAGDRGLGPLDPNLWFSHQHDPGFEPDDSTLTLYDNGNTRIFRNPGGHSRGQALRIDERLREARLILNADLGVYSNAVGSAQRLPNGDYHFNNGFLTIPPGSRNYAAQSVEVNPHGQMTYGIQFGQLEYRSFRMTDLYAAP